MQITGAEAVILSLLEEKVELVFGYPGGANMPIYDALYKHHDRLQHILVRHEQGAAHAAEGYAWATGKPGVCLVTSGPGATNLVTGITDAMMDSVPIICITGQVPVSVIGTDAFQEADVIGITAPVTKWSYQITAAAEIPTVFAQAFHIAKTGRPGPILIDITKNAQVETINFHYPRKVVLRSYQPTYTPNIRQIKKAADIINQAQRPYMLVGHGVLISHATDEVINISQKAEIPVALTQLGISAVPTDYKFYAGILGMHGNYGANVLTNKADVILAVGMRFHDRVTGRLADYAKQAQIIHIDIDPAELNKNIPANVPIVADAKQALAELYKHLQPRVHPQWLEEFRKYDRIEYEKVIQHDLYSKGDKIKMGEVVKLISDKTAREAIIVADVGQHQMAAMRYYAYKLPDSHITSGGLGTMGFALPAAMGVKLGMPRREVVAIIGDGSFQMTIQELATLYQEQLPVKVVILNNNYLGMVRQWQELFFEGRYSFVDLVNPDFVQVAQGFRLSAERVEKRAELAVAVERLLAAIGPYVLEVVVEKEENVFPMIPANAAIDEILLEPDR